MINNLKIIIQHVLNQSGPCDIRSWQHLCWFMIIITCLENNHRIPSETIPSETAFTISDRNTISELYIISDCTPSPTVHHLRPEHHP